MEILNFKTKCIGGQIKPIWKVQKVESVNAQSDCKTTTKNEQMKRKQTCSVSFVKVFKF